MLNSSRWAKAPMRRSTKDLASKYRTQKKQEGVGEGPGSPKNGLPCQWVK